MGIGMLTRTAGTAGLGVPTVEGLAMHKPAQIYFTGRNKASAERLLQKWKTSFPDVTIAFLPCDLQSLASVSETAADLMSKIPRLDILIANAGIMAVPAARTENGYETQFGTNHVGHALLVQKLLPALLAAPEPRYVSVTSQGYILAPRSGIPYEDVKPSRSATMSDGNMVRGTRYGNSKLANILYAEQLEKHYSKIATIAVHPGVIWENGLVQNLNIFMKWLTFVTTLHNNISAEDGAKNSLWAATCDKSKLKDQVYAIPVAQTKDPGQWVGNKRQDEGQKLWTWTQEELKGWM